MEPVLFQCMRIVFFFFWSIIGFDQSSVSDSMGNRGKVMSACLAFSVECISPWDCYRPCSSKFLLLLFPVVPFPHYLMYNDFERLSCVRL